MAATMTKADARVSFGKQLYGYNREQVERYIANITDAYQIAYTEYNDLYAKYYSLADNRGSTGSSEKLSSNAVATEKSLVNLEMLAQRIMEDACSEVVALSVSAKSEARKIMDDASSAALRVRAIAQKMIDKSNIEEPASHENNAEPINETRLGAADAGSYIHQDCNGPERVNELLRQSIIRIESILALVPRPARA
ncbi:MAG: DivIVA domain-containing protein [Oscillospiraceae bacterium]|nr:DivIVA domain-containing protein [Oscillospiraceae bacterium]